MVNRDFTGSEWPGQRSARMLRPRVFISRHARCSRRIGIAAADEGDPAGSRELANPVGANRLDERFDLPFLARNFNHHLFGADVDDPAPEDLHERSEPQHADRGEHRP